jgi:hypothetical protein
MQECILVGSREAAAQRLQPPAGAAPAPIMGVKVPAALAQLMRCGRPATPTPP